MFIEKPWALKYSRTCALDKCYQINARAVCDIVLSKDWLCTACLHDSLDVPS